MKSQEQISQDQICQQHESKMPSSSKPKFLNQIMARHKHAQKNVDKKIISQQKSQAKIASSFNLYSKHMIDLIAEQESQVQKKTVQINGNRIIGSWKNNELHGHIIIQYSSGQYFQGLYVHGQRKQGLLRLKDGVQYCGSFKNDMFHGKGTLTDSNKRVINCQWLYNQPQQKVTIQYPSGDIYYGQVQKFKKHGQGYLFFKDGSKYIGKFTHGKISGYGSYFMGDQKIAEGVWQNGILLLDDNICDVVNQAFKSIQLENAQTHLSVPKSQTPHSQRKNARRGIVQLTSLAVL